VELVAAQGDVNTAVDQRANQLACLAMNRCTRGTRLTPRSLAAAFAALALWLLFWASPASAAPSANDVAATHAYLEAKIAERRAPTGAVQDAIEATETFAGQLKLECPDVLGAMPRGEAEPGGTARGEIGEELTFATFHPGEQLDHAALARFYEKIRGLRWTNHKLTKLLHSLALEADEQSGLVLPPLCADLKFWVASGYTESSPATKSFVKRVQAISSIATIEPEPQSEPHGENFLSSEGLVERRLKRYEDHADRLLARKAFPRVLKVVDPRVEALFTALSKVDEAVGLTPGATA
jgi:hypothetical protein